MSSERINFTRTTAEKIGRSAMFICASPACLRFTGYETTEGKPRALAEAAHIAPAGKNGPRSEEAEKTADLKGVANGIWLCLTCHQKIDDDPKAYPTEMLKDWKVKQASIVRRIVGKDLEAAILALGKDRQHHQECQDFVSFLESRRVLYEGMDHENPPRVLDSLMLIRERVSQTRARLSPDNYAFDALHRIQAVIDQFFRNIGPATDLKTLRCDSSDKKWKKFASELEDLRTGIIIIMKIIAQDADYKLTWV
jgi:ribosomal protein L37AE/L43A/(2Fe-2S) ferredoxin